MLPQYLGTFFSLIHISTPLWSDLLHTVIIYIWTIEKWALSDFWYQSINLIGRSWNSNQNLNRPRGFKQLGFFRLPIFFFANKSEPKFFLSIQFFMYWKVKKNSEWSEKGIPIRKWRARFGRGFANFWDRILKFGTEVNFFIKSTQHLCPGKIEVEIGGENLKKILFWVILPTALLLINHCAH